MDERTRRRLRDEQRPMTFREAVLCGRRRPWTARQIKAAQHVEACRTGTDIQVLGVLGGAVVFLGHGERDIPFWERPGGVAECHRKLYAWATRVLAETAELEGTQG